MPARGVKPGDCALYTGMYVCMYVLAGWLGTDDIYTLQMIVIHLGAQKKCRYRYLLMLCIYEPTKQNQFAKAPGPRKGHTLSQFPLFFFSFFLLFGSLWNESVTFATRPARLGIPLSPLSSLLSMLLLLLPFQSPPPRFNPSVPGLLICREKGNITCLARPIHVHGMVDMYTSILIRWWGGEI